MSGEHFVIKCETCSVVISQCRCIGPKTVELGLCDNCAKARNA